MMPDTPSRLALGCSRIGSFNNPQSLGQSVALIRAAMDMGVTTFDTANIYGQGDSERAIGRAVEGQRDRAFIVTKTGRHFSAKARMLRWAKPLLRPILGARGAGSRNGGGQDNKADNAVTARRADMLRTDWTPALFAASLDASLRRLRTDHVDGFLLHSPPASVACDPAVGAALAALHRAGKVRHYGVSCDDLATLEAALTMEGLTMVQLPWDVIVAAQALVPHIQQRGIQVFAREVIKFQPERTAREAVAAAFAQFWLSHIIVGTTKAGHLAALAQDAQASASVSAPA